MEANLVTLTKYVEETHLNFPPRQCYWFSMDHEERKRLALDRVEEALEVMNETGRLDYPNTKEWTNVEYCKG